jgi:hypothetical protein
MGEYLGWRITEDLTPDERRQVIEVLKDVVVPGVRKALHRDRDESRPRAGKQERLRNWSSELLMFRYIESEDLVVATEESISIASAVARHPAEVSFDAGDIDAMSVGLQDVALVSVLATVATLTGKVRLMEASALSEPDVENILTKVEQASGYTFRRDWIDEEFGLEEAETNEPGF